jgi:signal transduction histidine kinase/ligand-binding sensor domain-containing protein/DNA-binding response OmpR family regulator
MPVKNYIAFFVLFLLITGRAFSQPDHYSFSRLDISNGLSDNKVTCFYKDKQGFLWVGTTSGLNRYDGYGFKVFRHDDKDSNSLSENNIIRILEGPDNKLWVEAGKSFSIFDPATEKFSHNIASELKKAGITGNKVTDLKNDGKGNFIFLTDRQVLTNYNSTTKKSHIIFKSLYQQDAIAQFSLNKQNECYLLQNNGIISVIDANNGKLFSKDSTALNGVGKNSPGLFLFQDSENELWFYVQGIVASNVLRLNIKTGESFLYKKGNANTSLNTDLIKGFQEDNRGMIWICTDHGGINVFNKRTNTFSYILHNDDDNKSLSQNSVVASYKDDNGIIWLGTYKQGICYYHENIVKFPLYRRQPYNNASLPFDDVNKFAEDAKGNLWIGTNGGGLFYFDRAANTYIQYKHQPGNTNSISNDVIVSLFIDHRQKLWIGTYIGGLDCYDNGKFTHYKNDPADPNSISDNNIWEIYEDSQKNLWVGTLAGGLNRFDREKNIFYRLSPVQQSTINTRYVSAVTEDRAGNLWIGTDNGVDVLGKDNEVSHYVNYSNLPDGISGHYISCLFQDSRGLMWIGTRNGLNVFNSEKKNFRSFKMEDGLPSNTIQNILEDNQRRLWISTTNGLSCITIAQKQNGELSVSPVNYDVLDGLQGAFFNENAALKTVKGEMIFGGANGFNIFDPASVKTDKTISRIALTGIQLFNRPVAIGEKINGRVILSQSISATQRIQLRHSENSLTIEFARLSFFNPAKIKYAYKLDGFNSNWIYTDGFVRKAIYTNLDPGTYTFRVKATDEGGQWNEIETTLTIEILPPFWKTPLAYLIYAALIFFALWMGRRIILDRAHMRFEVEQQRKEAERVQQLDALKTKFFTNVSHEFRTPLSLILLPLEKMIKKITDPDNKKQLQLVQRNAKRLLNLVNQLLDFRKMEVQEFSVHLSKDDMVQFAREITYSFSDISEKKDIVLTFSADTEKLETLFDKDKIEKILFNLLSNAFKYTAPGGKVNVNFSSFRNEAGNVLVQIKVSDTGIGIPEDMHDKIFERFYQHTVPGEIQNTGSGIGLAITKEFVKLHGGKIKVESEANKGTSFIVTLPVKEPNEPAPPGETTEEIVLTGNPVPLSLNGNEYNGNGQPAKTNGSLKTTILLVEDNEDFRFYLKDNLSQNYEVIEAVNGKEGWAKVKDLLPDMVVSDIMMPVMNGIELSKKIKTDPRTSHIPVILLTAMDGEEIELEGFRAGTNDYVTKPFTFEILASRIRNMLNLREQLRKKFQQQVEIEPAEITVTPVDEEFLKQAFAAVEKNMDNGEYGVEELSRDLFMGRAALYKKILALTGKTPIEFIRIMRLKRAAQLLRQSQKTIAEIAYEVGFNSPKIFAKHFKEEFGDTPSQYQSKEV